MCGSGPSRLTSVGTHPRVCVTSSPDHDRGAVGLRSHGRSLIASSLMRTVLLAISPENAGLFPVAIHTQRTGMSNVSKCPNRRSSHEVAVIAADTFAESRHLRRLSKSMNDGPAASFAVSRLRHSSSSLPSVVADRTDGAGADVAIEAAGSPLATTTALAWRKVTWPKYSSLKFLGS